MDFPVIRILMSNTINYDTIAEVYGKYRNVDERIIFHILSRIKQEKTGRILEIGCGTADHLHSLSQFLGDKGYGFDRSKEMISTGNKKNPGLTLMVSDIENTFPYGSDSFRFAFSVNVIHYIEDLKHYYTECHNTLENNGMLLTVTDSEEDIKNRMMAKYFPETVNIEMTRYHPIDKLVSEMEKAGFSDTEITHTSHKFDMTENDLQPYINKAYSAIRLVSTECFENGIQDMIKDVRNGTCKGNENYTYVWGRKISK